MGEVERVIKHVDYQINTMIHLVTFVAPQKCNFVFCFNLLRVIKKGTLDSIVFYANKTSVHLLMSESFILFNSINLHHRKVFCLLL